MANETQIGTTGNGHVSGIPDITVTWTGPSGTSRSLTIYTQISKKPGARIKEAADNKSEIVAVQRRNKTFALSFSAHARGAAVTDAQAILADLPFPMDILTVTCSADSQFVATNNDTILCDQAEVRYVADDEAVVDFQATLWVGKKFQAITGS